MEHIVEFLPWWAEALIGVVAGLLGAAIFLNILMVIVDLAKKLRRVKGAGSRNKY